MRLRLLSFVTLFLIAIAVMRTDLGSMSSRFLKLGDQEQDIVRSALQPGLRIHFWLVICSVLLTLMVLLQILESKEYRALGVGVLLFGVAVLVYCFSAT